MNVNLHRISAGAAKRRKDALSGPCKLCPNPSVGFVEDWAGRPSGVCQTHAEQGTRLGYIVTGADSE